MEGYAVTRHKESGIRNDPNDWSDDPLYRRPGEVDRACQLGNRSHRGIPAAVERTGMNYLGRRTK